MKYYQIKITETTKSRGANKEYHMICTTTNTCSNLNEVREYLKEHYGNCKRVKIYRDGYVGPDKHIGYIYCYNNSNDYSSWHQQDWVEVLEVVEAPVTVRG